jgi:ABC-type multidrug transport system fused ATPase/permease subunit
LAPFPGIKKTLQEPVLFARSIRENILLGLANPKEVAGKAIPASAVAQFFHGQSHG